MSEINFHFTYQIGDNNRINDLDRTLISKKSIASFFQALYVLKNHLPNSVHKICFLDDSSSSELLDFVQEQINIQNDRISIEVCDTIEPGLYQSTRQSYHWLQVNGKDFVYSVQDHHIFLPNALKDMYTAINQFKFNSGYDILTSPFNDHMLWLAVYRNGLVPRTAIVEDSTWIQYFNMSSSFMCIHQEFKKHWDIYNDFLLNIEKNPEYISKLSLLHLLTKKAFIFIPVERMASMVGLENEKDWKIIWDSVKLEKDYE